MTFLQFVAVTSASVVLIHALQAIAAASKPELKGQRLRLACLSLAFTLVVAGSWTFAAATLGCDVNQEMAGVSIASGAALYLVGNRRKCIPLRDASSSHSFSNMRGMQP